MVKGERRYSEAQRQQFANFLRSKSRDILERIARAYDWASDYVERGIFLKQPEVALAEGLKRQNLLGYAIGRRTITYNQARVVFEMVKQGKYGGLEGKARRQEHLESTPARPEGFVPLAEPATEADVRDYLKEYDAMQVGSNSEN